MQYFSPKGVAIHEKGIEPNITVINNSDNDAELEEAKKIFD